MRIMNLPSTEHHGTVASLHMPALCYLWLLHNLWLILGENNNDTTGPQEIYERHRAIQFDYEGPAFSCIRGVLTEIGTRFDDPKPIFFIGLSSA